jgi:membrane protease subunit (stomatin/prohibitin family)
LKIVDIIKYEGDNSTFVWKHPVEDFNTGTQLIVHESQEAVFFVNGQALDLFGPGRYTLETQNIPLLGRQFNLASGGETPFHCEVYFVNKAEQMEIKWGTSTRVEYTDPTYGFPLQIGASGDMTLRAEDSRKLLVKVVGTEKTLTQQSLVNKFRMFLNTRVKTYLVQLIKREKINIFEIDEYMTRMSDALREELRADFLGYGIFLACFMVGNFAKPEEDKAYQKFKELHFRKYVDVAEAQLRQQVEVIEQQSQAQRMVIEAQARAQKRALEGYSYQDERGFDVAERVASNQAVGQMSNLGVGLGMITGVGGAMGATVGGMMQNIMGQMRGEAPQSGIPQPAQEQTAQASSTEESTCPKCGAALPQNAKFCMECGAALAISRECPECGTEVPPGGNFCLECGHKMEV